MGEPPNRRSSRSILAGIEIDVLGCLGLRVGKAPSGDSEL